MTPQLIWRRTYKPKRVVELVQEGRFTTTGRLRRSTQKCIEEYDLDYTVNELIVEVVGDLLNGKFHKAVDEKGKPRADEYFVPFLGEEWLIKFSVEGDYVSVTVLTCTPDGKFH